MLSQTDGLPALLARLLYGTGLRLMDGVRLRIKDVDFDRHVIVLREAKATTMIYTHVLKVAAGGTAGPLDALCALPH